MAPQPDLKTESKALAATLGQARKKPLNFALLIGRGGLVFEADPRKSIDALKTAARKQGGGKGAWGVLRCESSKLLLTCEQAPPGNLQQLAKKHFAERGQSLQIEIALAKPEPDGEAPPDAPPPEDPEVEEGEPAEIDIGPLLQKARQKPFNFAWLISKGGLVLRAHRRLPIDKLKQEAKTAGGGQRGALGVMSVNGKTVLLQCEEAPPKSFPRLARRWLADQDIDAKIRIVMADGSEMADGETEEESAPKPESGSHEDVEARLGRALELLKAELVRKRASMSRQHAEGAKRMLETYVSAVSMEDPARALKALRALRKILDAVPEPKSENETERQETFEAASANAAKMAKALKDAEPLSDDDKRWIDKWLEKNAEAEGPWYTFGDDRGGDRVAEALCGRSALGPLTDAQKTYLAQMAAEIWRKAGSEENIAEAVAGVAGDEDARRTLSFAFVSDLAMTTRANADAGQPGSDERKDADSLMLGMAIDMDPAAVLQAFEGAEGALGRFAAGVDDDGVSRERQKALLDVVGEDKVDPRAADRMVTALFLTSAEDDLDEDDYRKSLARALGKIAVGKDSDEAAKRLDKLFEVDGVREMMFGEGVAPELRSWALAQAANNPDFTPEALEEGWESEAAAKAMAEPLAEQYLRRGVEPHELPTGKGENGALRNSIGQALGLPPSSLPGPNESAKDEEARLAAGLNHDYYAGNPHIDKVAQMIAEQGGDPAQMTTLPVTVTSNEFGVANFTVFRLETKNGPRFVDGQGNKYDGFEKWRDLNLLPPGKMTYPKELVLGADLVTENTPCVLDSVGEWVGEVGDYVALAAGITIGVVAIVGSGGLATPLVVAGAASAGWGVARAGDKLYDEHQRGKDITDLSDPNIRSNWIDAAAGALSIGAMGAAVRGARAVSAGAKIGTGAARGTAALQMAANTADAIAAGNQAVDLAANWDKMTDGQKAMGLLNMAFWGGMSAAGTKAGGALMKDAFSFTRLRNQVEFGAPYKVQTHPDLKAGEIRVAYDQPKDGGRATNIRIETGPGPVDKDMLALHGDVGRQVEAAGGLRDRLAQFLSGTEKPPIGSPGWEAQIEIQKISRESEMLVRRVEIGGGKLTKNELNQIQTRLKELADATNAEAARLSDFATKGRGWIASPKSGKQQAEKLGWPVGDDVPAGYTWVAGRNKPHLRKKDPRIPNMSYNPKTKEFEFETVPRVVIDEAVGSSKKVKGKVVRVGDPPKVFEDPDTGTVWTYQVGGDEKTINQVRTYDKKTELPDGTFLIEKDGHAVRYDSDGFPIFDSVADVHLDADAINTGDDVAHFKEANQKLGEALRDNPSLAKELGLEDHHVDWLLKDPPSGDPPDGFTWHHHQDVGLMQLVPEAVHGDLPHTGGMSIWGGGRSKKRKKKNS